MRKALIGLILIMAFGSVYSQGIVFEHVSFQEALVKAKKENKFIFMDCYTSWCGPCKMLAKNIFTQKEVGDFFNQNFVNVKMDMESAEGLILKKTYKIKAFPTLLWIDNTGSLKHEMVGGCEANHLIATAKIALDGENNWQAMKLRYKNGDRDESFLYNYILTGSALYVDIKEARTTYFSLKKDIDIINKKDAQLIMETIKLSSNPVFQFALKNKEKFNAILGTNVMSEYLEKMMSFELIPLILAKNMKAYAVKKQEILKIGKKIGQKVVASMDLNLLREGSDQQKYYKAMVNYALKYEFDNSEKLNRYARNITECKIELTQSVMNKVLRMAKRSVELNANFANIDTYACVLNKTGLLKEAKVQANKSIELAPEDQKKGLWSSKFLANN